MHPKEKDVFKGLDVKKRRALNVSIKEGSAVSLASSLGDTYITPFALALKAQPLHIGILSSISGLVGPIAQFFGSKLMESHSRKNIVSTFALLQAMFWLPLAILGFLFWKGFSGNYLIYALIIGYTLIAILGGIAYPAWFSWMGDLVPAKARGAYFSKRNFITGAAGLVAVIIGAFLLDYFKTKGIVVIGFILFFILAACFRISSYTLLRKQYNPSFKLKKNYYFSFWAFLKRFDNYGKFAVYHALFEVALMIASPFFAVYMLEELKFSYVTFMAVTISSSLFYLIFSPIVGKFSDNYGNRKLFIIACTLFSLNPLLWMIIKSPLTLILIPQIIAGFANAAFVIAVTNFTYDAVKPQHRSICVTYTNILAGIGIFVGSLLGGLLIKYAPVALMKPFLFVFLIAAIARFTVTFFLIPHIKEEKKVERLPPLHVDLSHPFKTIRAEIGWVRHLNETRGKV